MASRVRLQIERPSGWHVGFRREELAKELCRRFGWGLTPQGQPRIMFNTWTNYQMADVLAATDRLLQSKIGNRKSSIGRPGAAGRR